MKIATSIGIVLISAVTLNCGGGVSANSIQKSKIKNYAGPDIPHALYLGDNSEASCGLENRNQLVYITSEEKFKSCSEIGWQEVSIEGPIGVAGPEGPTGPVGPEGPTGSDANIPDDILVDSNFITNGILTRTGVNEYAAITNNSSNWDFAYHKRLQWDGGSTSLNDTTARSSLGLGTLATQNEGSVSISGGTITGVTHSNFTSTGIDDNATATSVTISTADTVGIGLTTPTSKLHVKGEGLNITGIDIANAGCGTPGQADLEVTDLSSVRIGDIFTDEAGNRFVISGVDDGGDTLNFTGTCVETGATTATVTRASLIIEDGEISLNDDLVANNHIKLPNSKGGVIIRTTSDEEVLGIYFNATPGVANDTYINASNVAMKMEFADTGGFSLKYAASGTAGGNITWTTPFDFNLTNGNATSGTSWIESDARLKQSISPHRDGLGTINQIMPIVFQYLKSVHVDNSQFHVGVIAQELQKIMPIAVSRGNDGFLRVNSSPVLWTAVNAIKQLSEKVDAQKKRIASLESYLCGLDSSAPFCVK